MKPQSFSQISRYAADFVHALRDKYPETKTIKGCLYRECMEGESYISRGDAAHWLCLMGYQRGFKSFKRIVEEFEAKFVALNLDPNDPWALQTLLFEELKFVEGVLMLLGMMNTAEAHAFICRVYESSPSERLRWTAVDAMGYEEDYFDREIIFDILKGDGEYIKCCAMWVFTMKLCHRKGSRKLMQEYIVPQLSHSSAWAARK